MGVPRSSESAAVFACQGSGYWDAATPLVPVRAVLTDSEHFYELMSTILDLVDELPPGDRAALAKYIDSSPFVSRSCCPFAAGPTARVLTRTVNCLRWLVRTSRGSSLLPALISRGKPSGPQRTRCMSHVLRQAREPGARSTEEKLAKSGLRNGRFPVCISRVVYSHPKTAASTRCTRCTAVGCGTGFRCEYRSEGRHDMEKFARSVTVGDGAGIVHDLPVGVHPLGARRVGSFLRVLDRPAWKREAGTLPVLPVTMNFSRLLCAVCEESTKNGSWTPCGP